MLNSLKVLNYKALNDFEISKLGRLNLIVGKNNSGKSTVLESIRILAAQGNPSLINEIIINHDDQLLVQTKHNLAEDDNDTVRVYEGLFSDRVFPIDDSPIFIGSKSHDIFVEIRRVFFEDVTSETTDDKGSTSTIRTRKIYNSNDRRDIGNTEQTIQIISNQYKDRPLYFDNFNMDIRRRYVNFPEYIKNIPISFIPTQFLSMDLLAALWDKTILTDYYINVKQFLKLISEDLEDIAFIKVNDILSRRLYRERDIERTGITKLKNRSDPIPLNSMGDGVMRILQLVLGIFPAAGGILLIDEFENGLHFSIQERLWESIFKLARELDIQVFATTHSWDCIEAFTDAANQNNDEAVLCKIAYGIGENKNKIISTVYEKNDLLNLTQADVELR
jgi:AAA15 family ATPase/GTPase